MVTSSFRAESVAAARVRAIFWLKDAVGDYRLWEKTQAFKAEMQKQKQQDEDDLKSLPEEAAVPYPLTPRKLVTMKTASPMATVNSSSSDAPPHSASRIDDFEVNECANVELKFVFVKFCFLLMVSVTCL
jgi:hypothetical protein